MNKRHAYATLLVVLACLAAGTFVVIGTNSPAVAADLSLSAKADTYTRADAPRRNFGTSARFSAQGSRGYQRHGFVKFRVPAMPPGAVITSATLRAFAKSAAAGPGVAIHPVGNQWTEAGLTWQTEPAPGERLAISGAYPSQSWVDWDVTAAVPTTGGTVSFRLRTSERAWLGFAADENDDDRGPQLVITTSTGATETPTTTATPPQDCTASGEQMPTGDLPGWKQVFADDFATEVPLGQFPGSVYGAKWGAYQEGWPDTTGNGTYSPSRVLSVDDCALDYYVHTEDGEHLVSAPTPKVPAGAYGKYSVRFRADPLPGYKTAWLLWPDSEQWPADGEIDWPEGNLDETMFAAMHHADPNGGQDWFGTSATFPTWHTATTTWEPGKVTFELDGEVIGTSTTKVPTKPMHWVLQTETSTDGSVPSDATSGHVQIDWVVAYDEATTTASPSPTSTSTPTEPADEDIVIGAVGDLNPPGNTSTTSNAGRTAASILAADPDAVAVLGDHQYQYGDCASLVSYLDKTGWGTLWPRVLSTAGATHDWKSATDLDNYRNHQGGTCPGQFTGPSLAVTATGAPVGPDALYAVDLGAWRVVQLSSGLWRYDTTKANAATLWLADALDSADAAGDHVVAVWHEPYWTSPTSGHPTGTAAVKPWVDLLDEHDVPLVLSGHQHNYERFHPQTASGVRDDAAGTQQFIAGTGGIGFYCATSVAANSAARQCDTFGWLKLTLHPDGGYDWEFVRTAGGSFTESGSR